MSQISRYAAKQERLKHEAKLTRFCARDFFDTTFLQEGFIRPDMFLTCIKLLKKI